MFVECFTLPPTEKAWRRRGFPAQKFTKAQKFISYSKVQFSTSAPLFAKPMLPAFGFFPLSVSKCRHFLPQKHKVHKVFYDFFRSKFRFTFSNFVNFFQVKISFHVFQFSTFSSLKFVSFFPTSQLFSSQKFRCTFYNFVNFFKSKIRFIFSDFSTFQVEISFHFLQLRKLIQVEVSFQFSNFSTFSGQNFVLPFPTFQLFQVEISFHFFQLFNFFRSKIR